MLCLGQDFWGTPVSLNPNFRGTFANSGRHAKSLQFLLVKLNTFFGKFLFVFLFNFELNNDSFGLRRGADDSQVVSATDVYYLDWAHIIFHQYYCLRVNRVQSAILKMVEIRILQRHLSL